MSQSVLSCGLAPLRSLAAVSSHSTALPLLLASPAASPVPRIGASVLNTLPHPSKQPPQHPICGFLICSGHCFLHNSWALIPWLGVSVAFRVTVLGGACVPVTRSCDCTSPACCHLFCTMAEMCMLLITRTKPFYCVPAFLALFLLLVFLKIPAGAGIR